MTTIKVLFKEIIRSSF